MTDYTELKRLARAAPEGPWFGPEYAPGTSYVFDVDLGTLLEYQSIDSEKDACLRYVAAANPAAVLALIAENERLERKNANQSESIREYQDLVMGGDVSLGMLKADIRVTTGERDQLRAEVAGLKTGYEAYERVNAELKAVNDSLRKERDARHPFKPFHEPAIGFTGCVICGVYTDHGGLPCPKTRATADAALGQGEQS